MDSETLIQKKEEALKVITLLITSGKITQKGYFKWIDTLKICKELSITMKEGYIVLEQLQKDNKVKSVNFINKSLWCVNNISGFILNPQDKDYYINQNN